jgi:hypothetical protein
MEKESFVLFSSMAGGRAASTAIDRDSGIGTWVGLGALLSIK